MSEITPSELRFTRTERVTMGVPTAEAIADQAAKMGATRFFCWHRRRCANRPAKSA